jgi:hypothetical protein
MKHGAGGIVAIAAAALTIGCAGGPSLPTDGLLAIGTWGGDNAGAIVQDSAAHFHVGCTYGDVSGRIQLDADGRFAVTGSYLLRAFPIAVGPTMPAQFSGAVDGKTMTFTVVVNDTVEHRTTTLGPSTVVLGMEPRLGPCPICRRGS